MPIERSDEAVWHDSCSERSGRGIGNARDQRIGEWGYSYATAGVERTRARRRYRGCSGTGRVLECLQRRGLSGLNGGERMNRMHPIEESSQSRVDAAKCGSTSRARPIIPVDSAQNRESAPICRRRSSPRRHRSGRTSPAGRGWAARESRFRAHAEQWPEEALQLLIDHVPGDVEVIEQRLDADVAVLVEEVVHQDARDVRVPLGDSLLARDVLGRCAQIVDQAPVLPSSRSMFRHR
jgi:hypothetical protein